MTTQQCIRDWPALQAKIERDLDELKISAPATRERVIQSAAKFWSALVESADALPTDVLPVLDDADDDAEMRRAVASALDRYRCWQRDTIAALLRDHVVFMLRVASLDQFVHTFKRHDMRRPAIRRPAEME